MEVFKFSDYTNQGISGGTLESALEKVIPADYYTIEHGINDWGQGVSPGTINDYLDDTRNDTFAAIYRQLIDKIHSVNPDARIVLCTPRKGYGFNKYLPDHWYDAWNGFYLKGYADIVAQIAEYEGLPLADFFSECGEQDNLHLLSIDVALHPNDEGYQLMANVLIEAFKKVITYNTKTLKREGHSRIRLSGFRSGVEVGVYTTGGLCVRRFPFPNDYSFVTIDLNGLSPGIYIVVAGDHSYKITLQP